MQKLAIGTVQFGMHYGISNKSGQTSLDEVSAILEYAKRQNIITLDTASAYGTSEIVLGNNNLTHFDIVSKFIISKQFASVKEQLQTSLIKLKVPRLYGYLAHKADDILKDTSVWHQDLKSLKQDGLIKKIGISFNEVFEIEKILEKGISPDIIQVPFNYFDNRFLSYMKALKKTGCEIHTRSPFLQGLFFAEMEDLPDFFDDIKPLIKELQSTKGDLAAMLLKYCIDKPYIDKVVFGVNNLQQLKSNIEKLHQVPCLKQRSYNIESNLIIPSKWKM